MNVSDTAKLGTIGYRTPAFFGLEDKWIETAPGELTHYHEAGSGTPVVFLHGSGTGVSAAANWWLNLPAVSGSLRAIAPDSIGWGATIQPGGTKFGIREWGRHVLRLLDALGIDKTWLVGNSLGGWIALQLAVDHPDRILGIVSMGTGGAAPTAAIKGHQDPDISTAGMRKAFGVFVTNPQLVTDEMIAARRIIAEYEVGSGRLAQVIEARERDRHAVVLQQDELARITAPVLLVHGLQDVVIPPERTWELVGWMPSADALILNRCGHWSQIERAAAFNDVLTRFVAGTWARS